MTRFLALWVVAAFWACPLAAQTIRVQSGEHPTFTRLVARIPDGLDWRVEQDGTVARFFVEGAEVGFDTSDVFSRIPRDRLSGLVQAEPGSPLTLELACRCLVSSFTEAGGFAVLDIGDPVEGLELPTLRKNESDAVQEESTVSLVLPLLPTLPMGNLSSSPNQSLPMAEQVEDVADAGPTQLDAHNSAEQAAALTQSERALQEQIARAALQGLVEIEPEDLENVEAQAAEPAPVLGGPAPVNIRAITAVDRDMNLASTPMKLTGGAGYCLDPDRLDISSWGNEEPFGAQVGAYRTRMAGEFDDLNNNDLIGLAKTYLYFAFGAEARQLLKEVDRDNSELEILVALSHLIDEGEPGAHNPFENQMHCDSIAALWSVYAEHVSPKDSVNSSAITRAFVELPPHIRDHIGPGLLRRFTNSGDSETAGLLLRIINRTSIQNDTPMQLAEAELIRLNGEEEVADQMVKDVAHGGSDESPEALVALVQRHFETRKSLPNHSVELLASYALELRRSDIGEDLARSHALALALSGDFRSAFEAVSDLEKESANEIFLNGLVLLTEAADDLTFLELSLVATHANPDGLPLELTMDIARRYIDIGFPDQATTLLERPMRGAAPEAFALLRAEASLGAGLPRRALLELVGRSGQKADALRAEALRQSGLHAEAAQLYTANNELPEAARSEWLAGLPPVASPETDSAYSDRQRATQRMAEAPAISGEMTLAGARALLQQAETLRQDIDKLNEPILTAE